MVLPQNVSQLAAGADPILSGGSMLKPATPYTWLIEAVDADGNSASARASFTTQ